MKTTSGYLFQRTKPDGSYYLTYKLKGKRETVCLHTSSLTDAEKQRDDILGTALAATTKERVLFHVAETRKIHRQSSIDLSKAWDAFIKSNSRPKSGGGNTTNYEQHWKRFTAWIASSKSKVDEVFKIDRNTALSYASHLESMNLSAGTFNHHMKTLRLVFKTLAFDVEYSGVNPFEYVKLKPKAVINREAFTKGEVKKILDVLS